VPEGTELAAVAAQLVAPGRGILAADESIRTMSARLEKTGVAPTGTNRRDYRELLVTTPGLAEGVSGVILCDETFRLSTSDGRPFPVALAEAGLLTGIKVDTGARPLAGSPGETVTEGLDGLRDRLERYADGGAAFAKWRAVIAVGDGRPSPAARRAGAHALARYAALCQEAGIVPVVEPEVLMTGPHSQAACAAATAATLADVFAELALAGVRLDGIVLKPNMVVPGTDSGEQAGPERVAAATVEVLTGVVPRAVAGIAFLSGGQPAARATANLAAMQGLSAPWPLTFSFGRALVDPALRAWEGSPARIRAGQDALAHRVRCNAAALAGGYAETMERGLAA
jgi:fructose-bisphosphate aldolase class I